MVMEGGAEGKFDIKLREQMPSDNTRPAICLRVFPPKLDCLQKLTNKLSNCFWKQLFGITEPLIIQRMQRVEPQQPRSGDGSKAPPTP